MNPPPLNESISDTLFDRFVRGWAAWFTSVFTTIRDAIPWTTGTVTNSTLDFPNIASGSQQTLTVNVSGALVGANVQVSTADVPGIIFTGAVTTPGVVTVYAKNFSGGAVNPPSQSFMITVLQG